MLMQLLPEDGIRSMQSYRIVYCQGPYK